MRTSSSQPTPKLGGIYLVTDSELTLLPAAERQVHQTRRPVIVLSGATTNNDSGWPLVLVAPLSTSTTRRTRYCVLVPYGTANVSKKTWVRVPAVQPLLKSALQDHSGVVPPELLQEIRTRLIEYQGMLDEP